MPTRAEKPDAVPRLVFPPGYREQSRSWTDDLPVCPVSGVGQSTNQIYREDGQRCDGHEFEDRSFRFVVDVRTSLYSVLDGHNGKKAADFAAQRMPAEILLGQLDETANDDQVRLTLQQAYLAVERGYYESIDDLLAEKAKLQLELPEGLTSFEIYQRYPEIVDRMQAINSEISAGTTAVAALIHSGKLYIANVGDTRAILCRTDANGALQVMQLSVDHDTSNEDELLRLQQLGLDSNKVRRSSNLGNQHNTRCIGNHLVKGGYKEVDLLSLAKEEPIISQPDICGGIPVDESFSFLMLMSKGLYKSLEEATGTKDANWDLASMVDEQFGLQATMAGVAQAVVDKVVRFHHDAFVAGSCHASSCQKRKDITLLVRNFNHAFPKTLQSPPPPPSQGRSPVSTPQNDQSASASVAKERTDLSTATTTEPPERFKLLHHQPTVLPLDEEGRVPAYVDFTDYYNAKKSAVSSEPS